MSLIIPANTLSAGGYAVDNSCRFNNPSSDYLNITPSSNGNQKTYTLSTWVKRANLSKSVILGANYGNSSRESYILFDTSNQLLIYSGIYSTSATSQSMQFDTNQLFRDVSAWYHIVIAVDTTQGTESNRVKIYVNGVQVTSFSTEAYPAQNANHFFNVTTTAMQVGALSGGQTLDGYLAETVFLDGTAAAVTDFGEFDDSGIWKPIDVSGLTFGTNGFYLDFKDSANLGNDASGGTDLTENNLTAIDQTTDTPTNNFATLNSLDTHPSATLSEGNLKIATTAGGWHGSSTTIGITLGQSLYFEAKAVSSARLYFGLSRIGQGVRGTARNNVAEGDSNWDYMWRTTTANTVYYGGSNQSITIGAISANDICACSVASDGEVKFYLNDSTVVTFSTKLVADYFYFPILSANAFGGGTESWLANFGNPAYAISSGNQDANGYGNFEYSTKGGYALNTKNLSEYG